MKITSTHTQLQQVKTLTQSPKSNTTTGSDSITFSPEDWICHKAKVTKVALSGAMR